ncbi:MAG: hypothetical protein AseanaTS_09160 [Candidatus Pelagadaptatus aseana]
MPLAVRCVNFAFGIAESAIIHDGRKRRILMTDQGVNSSEQQLQQLAGELTEDNIVKHLKMCQQIAL